VYPLYYVQYTLIIIIPWRPWKGMMSKCCSKIRPSILEVPYQRMSKKGSICEMLGYCQLWFLLIQIEIAKHKSWGLGIYHDIEAQPTAVGRCKGQYANISKPLPSSLWGDRRKHEISWTGNFHSACWTSFCLVVLNMVNLYMTCFPR